MKQHKKIDFNKAELWLHGEKLMDIEPIRLKPIKDECNWENEEGSQTIRDGQLPT